VRSDISSSPVACDAREITSVPSGGFVAGGMAVYFPMVWLIGGMDKDAFLALVRRKRPVADAG